MIVLLLSGIVALVVGGCVCVVWASRGGPRWTRAIATATLTAGELVRLTNRGNRRDDSHQSGQDG